jgi:hypothetical protein
MEFLLLREDADYLARDLKNIVNADNFNFS